MDVRPSGDGDGPASKVVESALAKRDAETPACQPISRQLEPRAPEAPPITTTPEVKPITRRLVERFKIQRFTRRFSSVSSLRRLKQQQRQKVWVRTEKTAATTEVFSPYTYTLYYTLYQDLLRPGPT